MKKIIGLCYFYSSLGIDDLYYYYSDLLNICTLDYLNELHKSYDAKWHKKKRSLKYINWLFKNCPVLIFATFTINEENIDIEPKLFRDRIIYLLNKHKLIYYGNLDKGKLHERLHAHVIINSRIDCHTFGYKLGNINFKMITRRNDEAICKYINKLTAHSVKETTYGRRFTNIKIRYK